MLRTLPRMVAAILVALVAMIAVGANASFGQFGALPVMRLIDQSVDGRNVAFTLSMPPNAKGVQVAPPDLPASAFSVYEGKQKHAVAVEHLGADKLEVVIVAHTENGATDLATVQATVTNLVNRLPAPARLAIVTAGPKPAVASPLTTDQQQLLGATSRLVAVRGEAVVDAVGLAAGQFSNRPHVRRTIVVVSGAFSTSTDSVTQASAKLTSANIATYVIRTNQATLGSGTFAYPLPVGGGQVIDGTNAAMVPTSGRVVDELARQYRLSFRVSGKYDPVYLHVAARTPTRNLAITSLIPLNLDQTGGGQESGLEKAAKIGALALGVGVILSLVFLPARRARARAARQPIRPLIPAGQQGSANGMSPAETTNGTMPASAAGRTNGTTVVPAPAGPGLGGEQVEGIEAVRELLRLQRRQVRTVWLADDVVDPTIEALAGHARVPVRRAPRADIAAASRSPHADGVLAQAAPLQAVELDDLSASTDGPSTVVLVDHMDNAPLGALLRTGVSCGVTGAVLPRQRSSPISPTATAAARGAIEHVEMVLVSSLPLALARLRASGYFVVGIDASAPARLLDLDLDLAGSRVALVIDGRGQLDHLVSARCDIVVGVDVALDGASTPEAIGQRACIELARRRIPGAVY